MNIKIINLSLILDMIKIKYIYMDMSVVGYHPS